MGTVITMDGDDATFAAEQLEPAFANERCLADKLGFWLRIAQKTFADLVNSELHRFRVTQLDYLILNLIANHPGCRQTTIAQMLNIRSPNLAAAIDYLVQRGLVRKTPDPLDRRANHLTLTENGEAFVDQLNLRYAEITTSFFPDQEGEARRLLLVEMLRFISQRPNMRARYTPRGSDRPSAPASEGGYQARALETE